MKKTLLATFIFFTGFIGRAQVLPPPGCNPVYAIDTDNDGYAEFNLSVFFQYIRDLATVEHNYDLSGYTLELYPSESDEDFGTNVISTSTYTNTEINTQHCYLKMVYSGSGPQYSAADLMYFYHCYILTAVPFNGDDDNDGVLNNLEDVNNNGMLIDDNTDNDAFFDFQDNDDDGDGILTISEDYNGNGNPADDDTDADGIPDYRESSVALSVSQNQPNDFTIYPNPASGTINLEFGGMIPESNLSIYNAEGKRIMELNNPSNAVDISSLKTGIYILQLQLQENLVVRKLIVM